MRSLGAVESIGLRVLCGLLLARVGDRIFQTASGAGPSRQEEVEGVDEERGGGDGKDVAIYNITLLARNGKDFNVPIGWERNGVLYTSSGDRG